MEILSSGMALILILLSTGASIVFVIKQGKQIYKYSYRILVVGFIFLTVSIIFRYIHLGTFPAITLKTSLSFFSWVIIGVYLVFQLRFNVMILGSFITPLVSIMLLISISIPGTDIIVKPMLQSIWLTLHVTTIFIGDGMFVITFMSGIMYLIQEKHIKSKKRGSFYSRLPSLETLDSANHYSLIYGFPFLTLGLLTGIVYAQQTFGNLWRWDPKEVWSIITWLAYGVLLHERLAVGWRGSRAALMSIVCFVIMLFTFLGGSLWLSDYHSFRNLEG